MGLAGMMPRMVSDQDVQTYYRDGVVLVRGLFADFVDDIRAGIARNRDDPGPYGAENTRAGDTGRFFDDYCN